MSLPPAMPREALHARQIALHGYRRVDGLYDIEAHLVDRKSETLVLEGGRSIPSGEPLHDMWIRLVVDETMRVVDAVASIQASPYGICPGAAAGLAALKGMTIGAGWTNAVRELFQASKGCTHLTELLKPLATVAYQTLWQVREGQPAPMTAEGKPRKIDSCYAYGADRELVRLRWPEHFRDKKN